jgi:hypothetical protein
MKGYERILGSIDCPYNFNLKLKGGETYEGKPPYPKLKVINSEQTFVREIKWQRILVRASNHESEHTEDVQIMRLVAILEDNTEMELSRVAVQAEMLENKTADLSKCESCGKNIPVGAATLYEGKAYHTGRCIR